MRHLKAFAIGVIGVFATNDIEPNPACSSLSTIYVTVPASPITKTIYAISHRSSIETSKESSTTTPAKLTRILAATQVISLLKASHTTEAQHQGPYSFIDNNGRTTWLGGETPSASATFDTVTSYLTIQSVPVTTTLANIKNATAIRPPGGIAYTGLGKAGWNATTFATVKAQISGLVKAADSGFFYDKHVTFHGTAHPKDYLTAKVPRRLIPRAAVGDVVVVPLDGVTVSWINDFNGLTATTAAPADLVPIFTSSPARESAQVSATSAFVEDSIGSLSTTVPIYPWDLSRPIDPTVAISNTAPVVSSTPSSTTSNFSVFMSASPIPSTTVGIYPWDLSPEPITSSISTTRATLLSTFENDNVSSTSSTIVPKPASCGSVSAVFTVTFDDLPHFDISSNTGDTDIPPIFNPYRKLYWQDHFGYAPPPSDPFLPESPPQLAVYRANNASDADGSPDAGLEQAGEIGAGPRASGSSYWIDARSMWFGCSDGGSLPCQVTINGYRDGSEGISISQTFNMPPCPGLKGCSLSRVQFANGMVDLSGLQILASVGGTAVDYYLDDLVLSWSNNSCAAQQERASTQ